MSAVFVDTSALMALLVPTDAAHARARRAFKKLEGEQAELVTSSYVLVETYALLGRRFGLSAAKTFRTGFAPLLEVAWIGADEHERGLDLLVGAGRGSLSLVDATSFVVCRGRGIERAFAYDRHFEQHGLELV